MLIYVCMRQETTMERQLIDKHMMKTDWRTPGQACAADPQFYSQNGGFILLSDETPQKTNSCRLCLVESFGKLTRNHFGDLGP